MQLNKKNLYIIVQTIIFFMALGNVKAAPTKQKQYDIDWSGGLTGAVKDASGINNQLNSIAVCIYSCSDINSGSEDAGKCGEKNSLWNWITYSPDSSNLWKINAGVIQKEYIKPGAFERIGSLSTPSIFTYQWESYGVSLPQTYYGSSTSNDKNENWQNTTESYKKLNESFVCPQYAFYDESADVAYCDYKKLGKKSCEKLGYNNTMELCYADDTTSCSTRNEDDYTTFDNANSLIYSFSEDLNNVLEQWEKSINNMTNEQILRAYGLPETEANSDEFLENICELLNQSEVTNQFTQSTIPKDEFDKMISGAYTVVAQNRINSSSPCAAYINNPLEYSKCQQENQDFEDNSNTYAYVNKNVFNFTSLSQLLVQGKGKEFKNVIYNNESMSDKFNNIINNVYIEKLKSATSSYQQQCEVKHGRKYDLDVNELGEEVKVSIEKIVSNYNKIDFDSLDCDNIFAEFANEIKTAYFFLEILSIIIVVVLSVLDYSKTILSDNQDEMKKSNQKLVKRLIILVVIFLLPAIINMTLKVFNIEVEGFNSDNPLCVKVKDK